MFYLIIFAILFIAELLYFRIADRFNIIDKPNERSSHNYITIRGGGVIYWVAALLYLVFNFSTDGVLFFVGVSLIAGVSFWDDVQNLGQRVRLLFHLLAMSCAFYLASVFGGFPWWAIIVYGVDAVMTILHRIYLKQNIMEAHRLHFYQILANERKVPHRVVSLIYFVLQLACSALIVLLYPVYGWWVFIALLVVLMGLYMIKFLMMHIVRRGSYVD